MTTREEEVTHALAVYERVKALVPNKANLRVGYGEILADEVIRLRAEATALREQMDRKAGDWLGDAANIENGQRYDGTYAQMLGECAAELLALLAAQPTDQETP